MKCACTLRNRALEAVLGSMLISRAFVKVSDGEGGKCVVGEDERSGGLVERREGV